MPRIQYAVLGDGSGTVAVSGRSGYVYVRIGGETGRLTTALNKRVPYIHNLPVSVGYEDTSGSTLQVLDVHDRMFPSGTPWDGESTVGQHASQHMLSDGADIVWINRKQILPLLVRTTDPISTSVVINPDYYRTSTGWAYFDALTVDLSSYAPAGYPNAKYLLLSLDPSDGSITVTEGSEFAMWVQAEDMTPFIPTPPVNEYPLAAIVVTYLGDAISYNDIYDIRQFLSLYSPAAISSRWNLFK